MAEQYEVLEIAERTRMGETNRIETFYVFRVRSVKGTIFTIRLSEEQLEPATAKMLIGARAKQLDALKG